MYRSSDGDHGWPKFIVKHSPIKITLIRHICSGQMSEVMRNVEVVFENKVCVRENFLDFFQINQKFS